MNKIKVYYKSIYGNMRCYVEDPRQAAAINLITGQHTLSAAHIEGLRVLGFEFEPVADPDLEKVKSLIIKENSE